MLIKDAEVNGQIVDIRCRQKIIELGQQLPVQGDTVLQARGASVLPGLHDHHLHFFALVAARHSINCGAGQVTDADSLAALFAAVPGDGWLRGFNYHESQVGELQHGQLEALVPGRPLRLQHSSGKMWLLNTTACRLLGLHKLHEPGIERDADGQVTGRLFRMDSWLRARLQPVAAEQFASEVQTVADELLAYGLTGFTDASYTNCQDSLDDFALLPQKVWLMGDASLHHGPLKIMLDDDRLPDIDQLTELIHQARTRQRSVALHCVSRIELLFAMAVLQQAGVRAGDRIEHGAVIPPEVLPTLAQLGVCVVTQPGFLADRGERYLRETPGPEHSHLYRYQTLLDAGVKVAASSDAPYGPVNPWQIMRAAIQRRTDAGRLVTAADQVADQEALRSYLSAALTPGAGPRKIVVGAAADLCILHGHWREMLQAVPGRGEHDTVAHTLIDGQVCYSSPDSTSAVCSPR